MSGPSPGARSPQSPRAAPSARHIPPRASLPCGRCPLYDQHVLDAPVGQLSAHEPPFKEAPSPGPGPRYLSHVLTAVHAPPRPRCEPSGRRPGEQARTIGPNRACGRPPGRGLLQRTRAATRGTASATASVILEMVPALSTRAERGGQVVLDIPHFSIPPAHQAW